tara:strand:+ start:310 stop:765 length:456 start_codon:yes stop_codon:yes gene_type:complete
MRTHIVAVGRLKRGPEASLYEHFANRLRPPVHLHEVEDRKINNPLRRKREAKLITSAIPKGAKTIVLDAAGQNLTSHEFSNRLTSWRDTGTQDLVFIIGGADGLTAEIRTKADLTMSFGQLTWPHLLVRGMLAEQLYRAQQIRAGHPYHRC